MKIGMNIFDGISFDIQPTLFREAGISSTFLYSELKNFDKVTEDFLGKGIAVESLHAPFSNINDIWLEGEAGEVSLARLMDSVDKCARYNIPVSVVHTSSGWEIPEGVTETGICRYERLFEYADKRGVTIAVENLRRPDIFDYFMKNYNVGFCWDCGHENCFTEGVRFMRDYGERAVALHIHDNMCDRGVDNHLLPFDGKIDFGLVAYELADKVYGGTLMLEISKNSKKNGIAIYESLTDEQFIMIAKQAAERLGAMTGL